MKLPLILKCLTSKLEKIDKYGFSALPMSPTYALKRYEVTSWEDVWSKAREYQTLVIATGLPTIITYYLEKLEKGQRLFNNHEGTMRIMNKELRFANPESVTDLS